MSNSVVSQDFTRRYASFESFGQGHSYRRHGAVTLLARQGPAGREADGQHYLADLSDRHARKSRLWRCCETCNL